MKTGRSGPGPGDSSKESVGFYWTSLHPKKGPKHTHQRCCWMLSIFLHSLPPSHPTEMQSSRLSLQQLRLPPIPRALLLLPSSSFSFSFFFFTSSSLSDGHPETVSTITSLLTHHRSKSRWSHLRSLLSSSAAAELSPAQFSRIALNLKSNPHLALRFFDFTLRNPSLCSHDLRSYATVIHILSRARLKARARPIIRAALGSPVLFDRDDDSCPPVKLFQVLVKTYRECDSAPFVFDLLIESCLDMKKIDASLEIVRMLMSRGLGPQVSTCNSLVSWVCRCKGSSSGYEVFMEVFGLEKNEIEGEVKRVVRVRPNVHSFNALMLGFYRDGEMGMVEEIWSEMERFGCVANVFSYSVLMEAFSEGGRIKEVEKLWEEMRGKGIRPDVVAYNTIIGGFCKVGEVEKAEEVLREMEFSGLDCSCETFEHLIKGYCRVGNVDSAILVYKDLQRKSFCPEALTVEVLIAQLCEKKRVSEALKIMRDATKDGSFCPSGKSYELLIACLCEDGKIEEALKVQAEMVGRGHEPNSNVYRAFIEGYKKLGNEEMVLRLGKEMSEAGAEGSRSRC